ncbi:MAG: hypothetical protein V7L22_27350 [Nostoc sp.]|uniref:hypothetical protein n=1 Tax=Nostoc sp. TaxID=1180 RepID=UPI002FFD0EB8
MSEKVVSREYKVLLKKELFIGSEQELLESVKNFWQAFSQAINNLVIEVNGDLNQIADQRIIKFYDTDEYLIYKNNYILRERLDVNNNEREVTLKFRNRDRYIAQDRNMNRGEAKFEEDIKTPFEVLYSFSDTQIISQDNKLKQIQDATQLYPDLLDKVSLLRADEKIRTIGLIIREIVIKGAKFQIKNQPRLDSKCALIIWYDSNNDPKKPVAVEFSFKYGDENEVYTRKVAQRAYDVFHILQEILTYWVDLDSDTKTAYIYKLDKAKVSSH